RSRCSAPALVVFYRPAAHRALPSFPTRRSSDLPEGSLAPGDVGHCRADRHEQAQDVTEDRRVAAHVRAEHHVGGRLPVGGAASGDRKSTRLNSSHVKISYAVFCLKKKNKTEHVK